MTKLRGDLAETQSKLVAARLETEQIRLKLDETADTLAARTARFAKELAAAKAAVPAVAGTEALVAAEARVIQLTAEKAALEQRLAATPVNAPAPAADPAPANRLRAELTETQNNLTIARTEAEALRKKLAESAADLAARTVRLTRELDQAKAAVAAAAPREASAAEKLAATETRVNQLAVEKSALEQRLNAGNRTGDQLTSTNALLASA